MQIFSFHQCLCGNHSFGRLTKNFRIRAVVVPCTFKSIYIHTQIHEHKQVYVLAWFVRLLSLFRLFGCCLFCSVILFFCSFFSNHKRIDIQNRYNTLKRNIPRFIMCTRIIYSHKMWNMIRKFTLKYLSRSIDFEYYVNTCSYFQYPTCFRSFLFFLSCV